MFCLGAAMFLAALLYALIVAGIHDNTHTTVNILLFTALVGSFTLAIEREL
jgi:hypothetical protein